MVRSPSPKRSRIKVNPIKSPTSNSFNPDYYLRGAWTLGVRTPVLSANFQLLEYSEPLGKDSRSGALVSASRSAVFYTIHVFHPRDFGRTLSMN